MNEILFNSVGRLRSGWRFLLFSFAYIFFGAFVGLGVSAVTAPLENRLVANFIVGNFAMLMTVLFLGWASGKLLEELPFRALGVSFHQYWIKDLLLGLGIGLVTLLVGCLLAVVAGGTSFEFNQTDDLSAKSYSLIFSLAVFVIGAANEEVMFRGYMLQTFSRANLAWLAIVMTSIFFASAHLRNPSATAISLANTALAGIWFSVAYLKTRNLWLPFGLHFVWNWVQGAIFGIPVSGLTDIANAPILHRIDAGPEWLTGGDYGIEGGIVCTIALVLSTLLIWFLPTLQATDEMFALTSRENPRHDFA